MKTLRFITIVGQKTGTTWEGIECYQEFKYTFTPKSQARGVLYHEWTGLQDALQFICVKDNGDFQVPCKIQYGYMVIEWKEGKDWINRAVDIPVCKLTKEYLTEDYPMAIDYISEEV